jgi:hypothetical protein
MDLYALYENGLNQLLDQMRHKHPRYGELLVYQQRLTENILRARHYSDEPSNRAERTQIIEQLNALALDVLNVPFNALCQRAPSPVPTRPNRRYNWGEAPDVTTFTGRETELETLTRWARTDRCRLMGIFGIGGMGKTAIATRLAHLCQDDFPYLIWRSLRNAPPLADLLGDAIGILSDQQRTNLPDDLNQRITLLVEYLRERRGLLVLDNYETLLKGGERTGIYREGYEGYGQLLQRVGESQHQSLVIVTSRDRPAEIARLEGATRPVRTFALGGVSQREGKDILRDQEIHGTDDRWATLIDRYSGNPLALLLTAGTIRDTFFGDIADFLKEGELFIGDVQSILNEQFSRLSALEQEVLYWLAIEREPVSRDALREVLLTPVAKQPLIEALQDLRRRSLIEQGAMGFTLQNVVMEYMTERLIEQVCEEVQRGEVGLLNTHALMKAQAKEYVRNSQVRLILGEVVERLSQQMGSREAVVEQLTAILAGLREGAVGEA